MRAFLLLLAVGCGPGESSDSPNADATDDPTSPTDETDSPPVSTGDVVGGVTIEPIYHAHLTLTTGGKVWMVDPWTKGVISDQKADVLLITDIHTDHMDFDAIQQVRTTDTVIVAPQAVADLMPVDIVMANGETKQIEGVTVTAVPMYNLVRGPEPGLLYHDKGRGNGYIVELGGKRFYMAGDTECTDEMKALTNIDVAFVPMNLPQTMPPDEAAACVKIFAPAILYPYHYLESDLSHVAEQVGDATEVRLREWYPSGQP